MKRLRILPCVVFVLIAYISIEQLVYSILNQRPAMLDAVDYLSKAVEYYRLIIFKPSHYMHALLTVPPGHRPPLYPFLGTLLYLVFGAAHSVFWLRLTNIFWMGLTLFSTYKIGQKSFSPKVGLTAITLFLGFSSIFSYMRDTMSETAFVGVTALAIWALLKTENFSHFRNSLWFGMSFAAGLLVKTNFLFFMALPVSLSFFWGIFRTPRKNCINIIGNFLLSVLIAMSIAMLFYIPNFGDVYEYITTNQHYGPIWEVNNQYFMYYLVALCTNISTPYFVLFIVGLLFFPVLLFKEKDAGRRMSMLICLLWFLSGYLSHALMITLKDIRFMFPYYPAVALIASYWIFCIKRRRWIRWLFITIVVLSALKDHWGATWPEPPMFHLRKE